MQWKKKKQAFSSGKENNEQNDAIPALLSIKNEESMDIVELSEKQRAFIEIISRRESVFITGAAGTGKSYVVRVLQEIMKKLGRTDKIALTAPTGVAACNIGGLTIHSWAGVGSGDETIEELCARVSRSNDSKRRWKRTDILVIDEISMMSKSLFDKLSTIGKRIRLNDKPFGGLQIIACGDFFQLPPVAAGGNNFCFESETWKLMFPNTNVIILDQVFRQKETKFLSLLHELRRGEMSSTSRAMLIQKAREYPNSTLVNSGILPTVLYSTNRDVDRINVEELQKLEGEEQEFHAVDQGPHQAQLSSMRAPQVLRLKVGAQVMLLKNIDTASGLVNGARGVIISFERSEKRSNIFPYIPVVKFSVNVGDRRSTEIRTLVEERWDIGSSNAAITSRWQIPLMMAYAISIHKAQGMTIAALEVSFSQMFEYGQAYVALSRATDWENLSLRSFDPGNVKAHAAVKKYYSSHGYTTEKIESDSNSGLVRTSVDQLTELFNYAKAPISVVEDNSTESEGWISSKRAKPLKPQLVTPNSNSTKKLNISKENNDGDYSFAEYLCDDTDDWMDRTDVKKQRIVSPIITESCLGDSAKSASLQVENISDTPEPVGASNVSIYRPKSASLQVGNISDTPEPVGASNVSIYRPAYVVGDTNETSSKSTNLIVNENQIGIPSLLDLYRANFNNPGDVKISGVRSSWSESKGQGNLASIASMSTPVTSLNPKLSDEQKRKIEQNRQIALQRLEQNRKHREQEAESIIAHSLK